MPLEDREHRDSLLRQFVKMRLTTSQLFELSQTWQFPFTHKRLLRRRLAELRLKPMQPHEQLPHRRAIIDVLLKLAVDAGKSGYKLTDVKIEHAIAPGVRVDLYAVIEGKGVRRVRVFEVQLSKQPAYVYRRKLLRMKALRKTKGVQPFFCVWLVEDRDASDAYKFSEVNKVYKLCCEVMKDSPNMLLFLVDWLPDYRVQYNVIEEDIFMSNKQRREPLI